MSHVTELARMEAEEAERENGDDDEAAPDDEAGPEPDDDEPEAAAPPLPEFDPKKLEAEQRRHDKALESVFGGLDAFDSCDSCGGLGVVPKGLKDAPEPKAHPNLARCEACDGYGDMYTGSRKPSYDYQPCPECLGNGYVDVQAVAAKRRAAELSAMPAPSAPPPAPTWDPLRGVWVDHLGVVLGTAPAASVGGYAA